MVINLKIAILALVSCVFTTAQGLILDVTKYGAKADGKTDLSQPLLTAFKEACASKSKAKIVVPKGTFLLNQAIMQGPCKAPIDFQLVGTIQAPAGPPKFKDDWFTFNHIENFTLYGGGTLDGQGPTVWGKHCARDQYCKNLPINLRFNFITNGLVMGITSLNSKQFQVNVIGCQNLTFENVKVIAPAESLNTDGIHIAKSTNIKVIQSVIQTGDDCISIGDGARQLHIEKVTCGPGHGISVGSLGKFPEEEPVVGLTVKNCTFINTDNGVRIKTWPASEPGAVSDIHYEDLIMRNVSFPIIIDQVYCPYNKCKKDAPSKVKLSKISFKNIRGTVKSKEAVQLICSKSLPCQEVVLSNIDLTHTGPDGPAISECANVKPKLVGRQNPPACTAKPAIA